MTNTKKSKILSFLLCFVMIATAFCQVPMIASADTVKDISIVNSDGETVDTISLPQNDKVTLTAKSKASDNAKYQWQVLADKENKLWVNINGEKSADIHLSYAMLCNVLDEDGTIAVRCKVKAGEEKAQASDPVTVTISKEKSAAKKNPENQTKSQIRAAAAKSAGKASAASKAAIANDTTDADTYNIIINYQFADGNQAANPWTAKVAKGSSYKQTINSPTVVGYAPDQEKVEVDVTNIQADKTYTVTYSSAEVNYTVKHYQQNVDNDKYALVDTETKTGYTESAVGEDLAKSYDGFYSLLYDTTTKIAADGSTVVEIYYDRYYYLMNFDLDGGYGVEPIYARYGTPIGTIDKPQRAGYEFGGWDKTIPKTMPAENTTYTANWTARDDVNYTVVFWYENADDENYSYVGSVERKAAAGVTVESKDFQNVTYDGRDTTHFTYNAAKAESATIAGDGSTVLNVYYTRNVYTLTFRELTCKDWWHEHNDNCYKTVATINAKYNAKISDEFSKAPFNTTYNGRAWECTDSSKYNYALQTLDRIPGFDATFNLYDKSSNTKKTIYYYTQKVGTTVSSNKWPISNTNFDLLKQVDTYFNYATYNEEYHEIQGFTRYNASVAGFQNSSKYFSKNNTLNLYYMRNSYKLNFYNYNAEVTDRGKTVQYEAPLKEYNFTPEYPSGLEENAYEFAGWYTSPGCYDGSEVDWNNMTMPASDMTLYAKWVPVTHTVKTYLTKESMNGEPLSSQSVSHGSVANKPDDPKNGNYTFVGWFYEENGVEKAFDFSMPIKKDLNLYAKWSSNTLVTYTIHYQLEDGTSIAPDTTGSALALTTKTFDAKAGTDLYKDYQTGYFPKTSSHSITMDIDGNNEYTFIYVPKGKVNYTVRYLEKGTNNVLHEEKSAETSDAVITEKFEQVTGYAPDAYQKRLVLSANEDENVIIFWYTQDNIHAPVQVVHWTQNITGDGYTEYQSSTNLNGVIGTTYTEEYLSIPGFQKNEDKSNVSGELTADGLVLNLYYDRIEYPYEFKFLEQGTDIELADPTGGNARYQAQVTEKAKDIPGYTLVSDENQAMNIAIEDPANVANKNIRTFYYTEKEATLNYEVVGPANSGSVSLSTETVKVKTGSVQGSTPTAEDGYQFVGWYKDEACTHPVDSTWVTNNKLTPQKESGLYKAATYYAKFEKALGDLKIQKSGCNEIDENQSFVFTIEGVAGTNTAGVQNTVTVHGNGSAVIKDLPIGEYTITEQSGWSWRYTPTSQSQKATITAASTGDQTVTVTFKNTRQKGKWLNGSSWCKNVFGTGAEKPQN